MDSSDVPDREAAISDAAFEQGPLPPPLATIEVAQPSAALPQPASPDAPPANPVPPPATSSPVGEDYLRELQQEFEDH